MNILLTNDDGYNSIGIKILAKQLGCFGRVVVLAPDSERTCGSCSITIKKGVNVTKISEDIYSCSGTPADCVSFGLTMLGIKFDLVVSGINDGWNISYDTLYSGTIAACSQALTYNIPAMSISCEHNFEIVEENFYKVYKFIKDNDLLSKEYFLNVNFPIGKTIDDIRLSSLYYRKDEYYWKKEADGYRAYRYLQKHFSDRMDSDCYLVSHNMVSITPMGKTLYDEAILKELKKKIQ